MTGMTTPPSVVHWVVSRTASPLMSTLALEVGRQNAADKPDGTRTRHPAEPGGPAQPTGQRTIDPSQLVRSSPEQVRAPGTHAGGPSGVVFVGASGADVTGASGPVT